ncbi:hypothetical protein [Paenibacillus sp. MBLB4367]|uniref:hypothetical protein n=1 Tax=Paenibacillus sp. MBLB4367 TaxID=3384767 RepID=UPI003907EE9C
MKRHYKNRIAVATLAFALSTGTVLPVFADDGATAVQSDTIAPLQAIGSISLSANSYIELKQAAMMPGDDGKTVVFTVTFTNGDDNEMRFIDYWVRLNNSAGTAFSVNLLPQDKEKNVIPAHSSMDVSFYAKVNESTDLSDLKFKMIKWDFSAPSYERTLGTITVPSDYSLDTPIGQSRILSLAGSSLKTNVKKVAVSKNDDYFLTSVSLQMENAGMKSITLPGLSYAIMTSEGLVYPLSEAGSPATPDKPAPSPTIAPRVKKDVQLTASIPKSVNPEGWKLVITNKIDDKIGFIPLAYFMLPASSTDTPTAPINEKRPIDINGTTVNTGISRVSMSKNDKDYMVNLFFTLENNGSSAVAVKGYQFDLLTKDGLTYPLALDTPEFTLNPKASKEVQLSVSIPTSVSLEDLKLNLKTASSGNDYPVASYSVPKATTSDVSLGIEYPYDGKAGSYTAKLNSVQRLPWEDQDILSAEVSIGNKGSASLPLPALQGYFLLDGGVKVEAVLSKQDNVISVPGQSGVNYILYAKVPYTSVFSDLKLVLQDKVDEKTTSKVAEFKHNSDLLRIPQVAKDQVRKLTDTGKSAELKISQVQTYASTNSDLFYAELEVKNTEKRAASAGKLAGYWKTKDDMYYPAFFSGITQKMAPNGKAIVAIWSKVPKGYSMADMSLVLGEAMGSAGGGDGKGTPTTDAYVRAFGMQLPDEAASTVKSNLEGLKVGGYTVSLSNVKLVPPTDKNLELSFGYTLAKSNDLLPELSDANRHKLVMEVVDSQQKYEQSYDLDVSGSAASWKIGTNTAGFKGTATDFIANRMNQSQTYTINMYAEFDGHRKLLATTTKGWFENYN